MLGNSGNILSKTKSIYFRSSDNLTDTIKGYTFSSDSYHRSNSQIYTYYSNGLKKSYTTWSGSFSFRYEDANEDYEYFYNIDGKLDKTHTMFVHNDLRQPLSFTDYYYGDLGIDSTVRQKLNLITNEYYKDYINYYNYQENGNYDIITYWYIPELDEIRKAGKVEYTLDSFGSIIETRHYNYHYDSGEWLFSNFYYLYEYSEYVTTSTQIENGSPRDKTIETVDENNNIINRCLYFWNNNQSYWSLDHDSKITYYYKSDFTAINEQSLNSVFIYPNPTTDKFIIKSSRSIKCNVYTNTGSLILQTANKVVDISGFKSGIYLVIIKTEDNSYTFKVVKQ